MSEPTPPTNQKYKFRLLPLDPKSPDDMLQAAQLAEAAFDSENSLFQRTYLVDPYPSPEERKKGTVKRLTYGLGKGKVAFKAVVDDPENETGKDGDMAGFSIWQPPGTGYRVFDSTDRERLTDEEKEAYDQVDLDGWNTLFGNMQKSRERLHGGKDHWWVTKLFLSVYRYSSDLPSCCTAFLVNLVSISIALN